MSVLSSSYLKPTFYQVVLLATILFSCTVNAGQEISIFGVSGLGIGTFGCCGAIWAAWLLRPVLPRGLLIVLLPLIFFHIDAFGTLLWYSPGMDGAQLVTVGLTFLAVIMVTARETYADPAQARLLYKAILYTSILPVTVCYLAIATGRIAGDNLNATRPFALYSMCVVAAALATWLGENRPPIRGQPRFRQRRELRTFLPLGWAVIITYVVLLGLSRTALVAIFLMFPLSVALRGNAKSLLMSLVILAAGTSAFMAILYTNQNLYNRFFHEDAHMKIGGVAFNSTGRSGIWKLLLDGIGNDWAFGKGISSSEDTVKKALPNVGQPHNDYLRFYFDQGAFGLTIYLIFISGIIYRMARYLRRSIRYQSTDYAMHIGAILALVGVLISMFTDNSVIYSPVMIPLAILLGCSLGTGTAAQTSSLHQYAEPAAELLQGTPWPAR